MRFITVIFVLFYALSADAQADSCRFSLKGIIIDSSDFKPLNNTLISVNDNPSKEYKTSRNGRFEINSLCSGIIELHISHLECEHIHVLIELRSDSFITIYLRHTEKEFSGISVSARKTQSNHLGLNSERNLQILKGQNISQQLAEIPGISILKTGTNIGKPLVNGLHGSRVILVNNGIRQEGQNWGMEHAPEIDAFLATEMELIKGAESLRYGSDGIGGVILIKPYSIFNEKKGILQSEINILGATNGRSGALNGRIGTAFGNTHRIYVRAQGTMKRSGNTNTPDDIIANTGSYENNWSVNAAYSRRAFRSEVFFSSFNTSIGIYTGAHSANTSDLNKAMLSKRPLVESDFTYAVNRPFQQVAHTMIKSRSEYSFNSRNKLELTLSFQKNHRSEFDILRSASSYTGPVFDYYINTRMGEFLWSRTDFHKATVKGGIFAITQSNAYIGKFFIPGFYQNGFAPFIILNGKTGGKFSYESSLRYDIRTYKIYLWKNGVSDVRNNLYQGISYLALINYNFSSNNRMQLTHSVTWRPPAPNELFSDGLHQGLASIEKGDSMLKKERSFGFNLNHRINSASLLIEYEIFAQYIHGFINLIPGLTTQLSIRGAYPVFKYTAVDAELYGTNFRIKYKANQRLNAVLQGNILYANQSKINKPVNMMPPQSFKLSLNYDRSKYLISFWGRYTAQQYRYTEASDFIAPPPSWFICGTDLLFETAIGSQALKLGLSVNNLLNTRYRDYMNRFRYFTDEQGINIQFKCTIPIQYSTSKKTKQP